MPQRSEDGGAFGPGSGRALARLPGLLAVDHVGLAVPDLDAAIAFYRDTYGMTLAHEEVNEEQGVREAMMAVGGSGSHVQLLAPLSPESTIARFLDRSGEGVYEVVRQLPATQNGDYHYRIKGQNGQERAVAETELAPAS